MKIRNHFSENKGYVGLSPDPDLPSLTIPRQTMTVKEILTRFAQGGSYENAMGVRFNVPDHLTDEVALEVYLPDQEPDELTRFDALTAVHSAAIRDDQYRRRQLEEARNKPNPVQHLTKAPGKRAVLQAILDGLPEDNVVEGV
jgi:hypothetical protein